MYPKSLGRLCGALVAVVALTVATLGFLASAHAADLNTVVSVFANGEHVFIEENAQDDVTAAQLNDVVVRAGNGGINLYIAVLGEGSEAVDAELVRDALGQATVAVFTPTQYRLATKDICSSRFDEARARADTELGTAQAHDAAQAFVDAVLTIEPCESSGGLVGLPWWAFALGLVLFAGFAFVIVRSMGQSRRATQTAKGFEERRDVLRDWALSLRAPITQLQQQVAGARSPELTRKYTEALEIAKESESEVMGAQGMPDLDRAEMRIARAQMHIRDLRQAFAASPRS